MVYIVCYSLGGAFDSQPTSQYLRSAGSDQSGTVSAPWGAYSSRNILRLTDQSNAISAYSQPPHLHLGGVKQWFKGDLHSSPMPGPGIEPTTMSVRVQ